MSQEIIELNPVRWKVLAVDLLTPCWVYTNNREPLYVKDRHALLKFETLIKRL